jgi:ketosteroid isomerase-like protein
VSQAAGCALRAGGVERATVDASVRKARGAWNAALAARDTQALARLVEDSAVHVSPTFLHTGRAAFLAQFLRAMFTRPQFKLNYQPALVTECTRLQCLTATEYGTWSESWQQEGEYTEVGGTYFAIWRRNGVVWQLRSEAFATAYCRGRRYCGP